MKLWASLYLLVWVAVLAFPLGTIPDAGPVIPYLHALVGVAIIALAYSNSTRLRASTVPGRLKRISAATLRLSVAMAVLGILLWLDVGSTVSLLAGRSVWDLLVFLHLLLALAVVTQAAAVAIAYDMWEDREFLNDTRPGEVPPAPVPGAPRAVAAPSRPSV